MEYPSEAGETWSALGQPCAGGKMGAKSEKECESVCSRTGGYYYQGAGDYSFAPSGCYVVFSTAQATRPNICGWNRYDQVKHWEDQYRYQCASKKGEDAGIPSAGSSWYSAAKEGCPGLTVINESRCREVCDQHGLRFAGADDFAKNLPAGCVVTFESHKKMPTICSFNRGVGMPITESAAHRRVCIPDAATTSSLERKVVHSGKTQKATLKTSVGAASPSTTGGATGTTKPAKSKTVASISHTPTIVPWISEPGKPCKGDSPQDKKQCKAECTKHGRMTGPPKFDGQVKLPNALHGCMVQVQPGRGVIQCVWNTNPSGSSVGPEFRHVCNV